MFNSLADMYAKCRNLETSIRVFKDILKKDIISWRTIIRGCIENECPKRALYIFLKMRLSCFQLNGTIIRDTVVASSQAEEHKFGLAFHCYILKVVSWLLFQLELYLRKCTLNLVRRSQLGLYLISSITKTS
jgi:pentatricopeptide repeat protein